MSAGLRIGIAPDDLAAVAEFDPHYLELRSPRRRTMPATGIS